MEASVGFAPSSFFLTGAFGAPVAAAAGGGAVAPGGVAALSPAACFAAAALALASAILAAFSASDCVGCVVGSPIAGEAPPGGCAVVAACSSPAVGAGVSPEESVLEAGTVVPLVELPEGALPVSAAWLSGVGGADVSLFSGIGKWPASVLSKPGLGLLSSARFCDARGLAVASGADGVGAGGGLGSSAISYDYTLTRNRRSGYKAEREHTYALVS